MPLLYEDLPTGPLIGQELLAGFRNQQLCRNLIHTTIEKSSGSCSDPWNTPTSSLDVEAVDGRGHLWRTAFGALEEAIDGPVLPGHAAWVLSHVSNPD